MNAVTDPELLAQLNGDSTPAGIKPVTDPALLEQLNGGGDKGHIEVTAMDATPDDYMSPAEALDKGLISGKQELHDAVEGSNRFNAAYRPETVLPGAELSAYDVNSGDYGDTGGSIQGAYSLANGPLANDKALVMHQQPDALTALQQAEKARGEGLTAKDNRPLGEAGNLMSGAAQVPNAAPVSFGPQSGDTRAFQQYDHSNLRSFYRKP
jgi:hypothetical protein